MKTAQKSSAIDWLFPKTRRRVLALLYMRPEERWHLRDIARRVGCALGTVRRELHGLAKAEVVTEVRDGNRAYFQANTDSPIFADLRGIVLKTVGLADVLRDALSPLADQIRVAFVYGSQASGDASASSDVDLMVIGEPSEVALHRAVSDAEERLDRPVNYTLLSSDELARRRQERGGFIERVFSGDKISVLGDPDAV